MSLLTFIIRTPSARACGRGCWPASATALGHHAVVWPRAFPTTGCGFSIGLIVVILFFPGALAAPHDARLRQARAAKAKDDTATTGSSGTTA